MLFISQMYLNNGLKCFRKSLSDVSFQKSVLTRFIPFYISSVYQGAEYTWLKTVRPDYLVKKDIKLGHSHCNIFPKVFNSTYSTCPIMFKNLLKGSALKLKI